ncbi:MAG: hypothetical protein WBR18_06990 [Anaerolineales bacterium]
MPEPLTADNPNLQLAKRRHRRIQWIWAALFAGMAVLAYATVGSANPWSILPWAVAAILLAVWVQPVLQALVAVLLGLSLVTLFPGLAQVFGGDPIAEVFPSGAIEIVGQAVVRLVLAVTAWNQFMLYRMLYGTARGSGLADDQPPIPEVIRNDTNQMALLAAALAGLALIASVAATVPAVAALRQDGAQIGFAISLLAIGIGLGTAFSPTDRRGLALISTSAGMVAFLIALAAGSSLAS